MVILLRLFLLSLVLNTSLWAAQDASVWYFKNTANAVVIPVTLFLSSTCPYCHKEDAFFRELETKNPWLRVERHIINEDKNALILFNQMLTAQDMTDFSVPSAFFCDSRWVGFASAESTGKNLLQALTYCKQKIEQQGNLSAENIAVIKRWAQASLYNANMSEKPSTVQFIAFVAFLDAMSPCGLFGFAAFIALVFLHATRKQQYLNALLFVLPLGCMHYFQQVYANAFFESLYWLRWVAVGAGLYGLCIINACCLKRFYASGIMVMTFLFSLMIQAYQQTCLMNWSYLFEQWLADQSIAGWQSALLQLIYQLLYLLPFVLLFYAFQRLQRRAIFARLSALFKDADLLLLAAIALCLIAYPDLLAQFNLSLIVLIAVFAIAWGLNRIRKHA